MFPVTKSPRGYDSKRLIADPEEPRHERLGQSWWKNFQQYDKTYYLGNIVIYSQILSPVGSYSWYVVVWAVRRRDAEAGRTGREHALLINGPQPETAHDTHLLSEARKIRSERVRNLVATFRSGLHPEWRNLI